MSLVLTFGDRIKKIKQEGCVHVFGVTVDPANLKTATEAALVRLQSVVSIPGFRTGKVPLGMIKAQFPSMVKDEVLDLSAKAAMPEILKADKVMPVVTPIMKNVSYEPEKVLYFEVQLECNPQVDPKGYTNIAVTRKIKKVVDEDVAKYIDQVREYNAYLKPVEEGKPVEKNHFVIVNYESYENGVKVSDGDVNGEIVDMSSPQTIAGLADHILGAKKGEAREFESSFGEKKMSFKATVVEIKQKVVPAIDDNFLKEAGVKTAEELRENVRKLLERGETEKTEKDVMTQIEDALIKTNPMQLPPTLVREEAHELFEILKKRVNPDEEIHEDAFMERLKPVAERNLSLTYLLHNIAKKESITATEAELAAELDKVVARLNTEEEKKKARELFEKRKDYIMSSIVENKTMDLVKSKAVIKEETH
ncbi:MAG: trigger factor [Elusimicrobia bacterium RIFOXYA12_FULL_51_18]|nr:MAG: trigger factor [Elusimicrobia bacterium RIFOXYA12_FULL_51_18]OGS29608.1 MAG: trigger factor [Elusimicrobia bacterium RIFOXYA2_FULL_53_38]